MNWSTYHRRESQKHKKMTKSYLAEIFSLIFYKNIYLGPSLWFTLFWEPHKATAWASSNNDSNNYT